MPVQPPTSVIAIGYAEGGIPSLIQFFEATPCDGVCYVVLDNVPATEVIYIKQILTRHSVLAVTEAADGMQLTINHVYLLPPGKYMKALDGYLRIIQPHFQGNEGSQAIDTFLISLSKDRSFSKIAIFFSGAGNDGVKGAISIQESGGKIFVQDPATCPASHLPEQIISATRTDIITLPEKMPALIQSYVHL